MMPKRGIWIDSTQERSMSATAFRAGGKWRYQCTQTWQHTRKMNRVMAVHSTFSLNWICEGGKHPVGKHPIIQESRHMLTHTFLSGFWISGKTAQNGLMTSKNLTAERDGKSLKRGGGGSFSPLALPRGRYVITREQPNSWQQQVELCSGAPAARAGINPRCVGRSRRPRPRCTVNDET